MAARMHRIASLALGLSMGLVGLVGCGRVGADSVSLAAEGSSDASSSGAGGIIENSVSIFDLMRDAPFMVPYTGVRRVTMNHIGSLPLDYREEVAGDGLGSFAIEPIEILSAHPNAAELLIRKGLQQTFDYRNRDFRVLVPSLFQQNYNYTLDPNPSQVLGRDCFSLTVQRPAPYVGGSYAVQMDVETKLVLDWREYDASGNEISHVAFESLELQSPDFNGFNMVSGFMTETELDIQSNLAVTAGFAVLTPSLPPTGFELYGASLLESTSTPGDPWVRLLYTDGLERVWILHRAPAMSSGGTFAAPVVHVYPTEAWTVAVGKIGGYEVMAAGRVPKKQILQMLESCF
ncbi:MAG: hypothetical protein ACI8QC_000510 [Planctomycetota bacterium]|jgi:hypothetical protein